jgi:hypothetical protein
MDPRAAEVHRRSREIHGGQPPTDPAPRLDHSAVHTGVRQGVGDRETGDARADHQDALETSLDPAEDLAIAVVEADCRHASDRPTLPTARRAARALR